MTIFALLLLALGLSVDAFAAAMAKGSRARASGLLAALRIGVVFGLLEGLMPLIGWALGQGLQPFVMSVDHWIAFALLAAVGGHMLVKAIGDLRETAGPPKPVVSPPPPTVGTRTLVLTAVGTSIDAAAIGVSLAFVDVDIITACLTIGLTTFAVAVIGVLIGARVGQRLGAWAELLGGLVLIGIGALILVQHLAA